jgi:MinD-like ATPase involved in chromosome partitioning or flagellar assembly
MIYTFYSYKGGVGRTHLLANLASYLCHYRKRRVLLIDWNLEAPGLHFYFGKKDTDITSKGLVDLCEQYINQVQEASEENPLTENDLLFPNQDYLTPLVQTAHVGKIDLLPATNYETGYHTRINAFDWIDFYDHKQGNVYLAWLKEQLKKRTHYDYVFIDSRTGQNDYSGICNVLMPDMNILVMAPNIQNFEGAKQMADRILHATYTKENRKDKAFILPILSKVDNFFGERADEWKRKFVDYFEFIMPSWEKKKDHSGRETLDIILNNTILYYNAEFAMGERTYFTEDAPPLQESSYLKNFENIALNYIEQLNSSNETTSNATLDWKLIDERLAQGNYADVFSELDEVEILLGHLRPTYNQLKSTFRAGFAGIHFNQMLSVLLNNRELRTIFPQTEPSKIDKTSDKNYHTTLSTSKIDFKVMVFATNPQLVLEMEVQKKAWTTLVESYYVNNIKFVYAHSVGLEDIMTKILHEKPNILHFSGFGGSDGIMLVNPIKGIEIVNSAVLGTLFEYLCIFEDLAIDVVILDGCYSEEQANVINKYVKYVVGVIDTTPKTYAISFNKGFYLKLSKNKDTQKAFEAGRVMAVLDGANKQNFIFLENLEL